MSFAVNNFDRRKDPIFTCSTSDHHLSLYFSPALLKCQLFADTRMQQHITRLSPTPTVCDLQKKYELVVRVLWMPGLGADGVIQDYWISTLKVMCDAASLQTDMGVQIYFMIN